MKGVNENESDPTRRNEEVIFTDWLIGIFSQQGFFLAYVTSLTSLIRI